MTADEEIQRTPRSVLISDSLLQRVNDGEFVPGGKLPSESKLQQQYGVSRPVIREALQSLVGQGVVVVEKGRGALVREVNETGLRSFFQRALTPNIDNRVQLMELRAVLERYSVSRAAELHSRAQLEQIERVLEEMRNSQDNLDDYSRHDVEFHIEIARASGNDFVCHLISSIRNSLLFIIDEMRHDLRPDHLSHVQNLHERVFAALARRDADEAVRAMGAHFEDVLERTWRTHRHVPSVKGDRS